MPQPERLAAQQRMDAAYAGKKPLIVTDDATDLPSVIALLNEIKAKLNAMNAPAA